MTQIPSRSWVDTLIEGSAATPAKEILFPEANFWKVYQIDPPSLGEAYAFSVVSRLLKYGKSLGLILPNYGSEMFLRLLVYLHRLRIDAVNGLIRSPWLQSLKVGARGDLLFLTRPMIRSRQIIIARDLHAQVLRPPLPLSASPPGSIRTILADGNIKDRFSLFASIEQNASPFVFVIDGTPIGMGEEAVSLEYDLFRFFPGIPRITLGLLGDTPLARGLSRNGTDTQLWHMRLGDVELLEGRPGSKHPTGFEIHEIQDTTADILLKSALIQLHSLKSSIQAEDPSVQKQILSPLFKVFHTLCALPMPAPILESALTRCIRTGLYPRLPLNRWLERVRGIKCRYGDTNIAVQTTATKISEILATFNRGTTGKTQALLSIVNEAILGGRSLILLVGTKFESDTLASWLFDECDAEAARRIIVHAMDGIGSNKDFLPEVDQIIVLGTAWPNRLYWLAHPCRQVLFLAYPFEANSLRSQLTNWWQIHGQPSIPDGDKLALWSLQWPKNGRCVDSKTITLTTPPIFRVHSQYRGSYPPIPNVVEFTIEQRHEDWLEALVAEPNSSYEESYRDLEDLKEVVWIRVEEYLEPIPWPRRRLLLVLREDILESVMPESLEIGNEILFLPQSEERIAAQAALFKMFVADSIGLEQHLLFSEKWQALIDAIVDKFGSARNVRELLAKNGVQISEQAVRSWIHHERIGPDNPKVIEIFAGALGHLSPVAHSKKISNAINYIRQEHRNIGRDLRKAIMARAEGATAVKIGRMTLNATELDAMIEICHVVETQLSSKIVGDQKGSVVKTPFVETQPLGENVLFREKQGSDQ